MGQALEPLHKLYWKTRNRLAGHARTLSARIAPSVFLLRGPEKVKGEPLSFLYCGNDGQYRHYITHLAFGSEGRVEELGRMLVSKVLSAAGRDKERPVHAAWIEWNPVTRALFGSRSAFALPRWVEAWLDIPSEQEIKRHHSFGDAVRRIKKHGYTYEISRDRALYDHFYHRMYEPSIRNIHGDSAYIIAYPFFRTLYDCSELLLVRQEGEDGYIAGAIIQYEHGDVLFAYIGFKEGEYRFVRDGAAAAVYYFVTQRLREQGYSRYSMGGCKSFLDDGVLKMKMQKGAYIGAGKYVTDERIMLLLLEDSPGLRQFLLANPFLRLTGQGAVEGTVFSGSPIPDGEAAEALIKPYLGYRGIGGWHIHTLGGEATGPRQVKTPGTGDTIMVSPLAVG